MPDVYELVRKGLWNYKIVPPTRFKPPYSQELREKLALQYIEYAGGVGYDGPMVCLEGISKEGIHGRTAYLSISGFYDFVNCNLIGREAQDPQAKIYRYFKVGGADREILDATSLLGANFAAEKERITSFEDFLETTCLPNAMAVSILVHDENDNYLLSRRTSNVLLSKGFYGVTASGSVDPGDLANMPQDGKGGLDPFCACAARELAEEIKLGIPDGNFHFKGLVVGKEKLQPIALVDALYPRVFPDQFKVYDPSEGDPDAEVAKIVAVPQSSLAKMPDKYEMTEASARHIMLHA